MANKIFNDAADKNVSALLVYVDSDGYACSDAAATVKMTKDELQNAFLKRCFIAGTGSYMAPTKLVIETTYCAVVCAGLGGSGADITIYSKEYEPASDGGGDGVG